LTRGRTIILHVVVFFLNLKKLKKNKLTHGKTLIWHVSTIFSRKKKEKIKKKP